MNSTDQFSRIKQLWASRDALGQAEWAELYQRIVAELQGYRPKEAGSLPDTLDDLRHAYFVERVYTARGANGPEHAGALRLYFRRFLLDLLRQQRPETDNLDDGCDLVAPADDDATLRRYGTTPGHVRAGAAAFLHSLSPDMQALLRHCGCGGLPVRELAQQIASAHYHCGKLGLVHRQAGKSRTAGEFVLPAHRRTLLGRWVTATLQLEDALSQDDVDAAQIVLDILCAVALTEANAGVNQITPGAATA